MLSVAFFVSTRPRATPSVTSRSAWRTNHCHLPPTCSTDKSQERSAAFSTGKPPSSSSVNQQARVIAAPAKGREWITNPGPHHLGRSSALQSGPRADHTAAPRLPPNFECEVLQAAKSRRRNRARMSTNHVRRDKAALFQRVQVPPGDRSSRKQPEQAWR